MSTVAGIFQSRADTERAAENLRSAGISDDRINLLTPDTTPEEVEAAVPTSKTEQPGMKSALNGTVNATLEAAKSMHIDAALASLLIPGVGPVFAAGAIKTALLGAGGAVAGASAGSSFEENVEGLPVDELYVYEDALRKGHSVVIALADGDEQTDAARSVLSQAGAESVDATRKD